MDTNKKHIEILKIHIEAVRIECDAAYASIKEISRFINKIDDHINKLDLSQPEYDPTSYKAGAVINSMQDLITQMQQDMGEQS